MTPGMYDGYLRRLGFPRPPRPTAEALFALQRAHLERIPYENLDIQLGRPPGIDPELSVRRFAAGRGGYCFHLNGAFAQLLEHLGFAVTRHLAGVLGAADRERRDVSGDHLALTVRVDGKEYFVDAGLGDGPYEPLPLRAGTHRQGAFTYELGPLEGDGTGWRYVNEAAPCPVVNILSAPATTADFEATHVRLSSAPDSGFVRTLALLRRDADGVDTLRGRVLSRIDPVKGTSERVLDTPGEFWAVIGGLFERELDDLTAQDRSALWDRVCAAHAVWLAGRTAEVGAGAEVAAAGS
ncbi:MULTISPECIES: arylamine N-acetyltransferase [unclassified Streptomyces]|uniref:arylamine N-acetyltransferase family protein n=1 Tax=unclassified Streptomyces TaxID=2593676 RepID=UPI002E0F805D|nr:MULTISPECIES: arylamine N-acetyltransferase [unclassified Streptomyces]WSR27324.1 arylamine N-acetyltransferase [Streptomyces sp. NBC_01205]